VDSFRISRPLRDRLETGCRKRDSTAVADYTREVGIASGNDIHTATWTCNALFAEVAQCRIVSGWSAYTEVIHMSVVAYAESFSRLQTT